MYNILYISLQHCKSTHPISMADCTYLALTWVLKHFLCSRKGHGSVIFSSRLRCTSNIFRQKDEQLCQQLFAKMYVLHCIWSLKPTVKFILLSDLSLSPPLHDNIARRRCLKRLQVNPSSLQVCLIMSFKTGIAAACLWGESLLLTDWVTWFFLFHSECLC